MLGRWGVTTSICIHLHIASESFVLSCMHFASIFSCRRRLRKYIVCVALKLSEASDAIKACEEASKKADMAANSAKASIKTKGLDIRTENFYYEAL